MKEIATNPEYTGEICVAFLTIYMIFAVIAAKAIDRRNQKLRDAQSKLLNDVLDFAFPETEKEKEK